MTKDYTWALQIYLDGDKELDKHFREDAEKLLAVPGNNRFSVRAQMAEAIKQLFTDQIKLGTMSLYMRQQLEHSMSEVDWLVVATRYVTEEGYTVKLTGGEINQLHMAISHYLRSEGLSSQETDFLMGLRRKLTAALGG